MGYWKMHDFTKAELARVDQDEFMDELYVLRHSPAARKVFAKAQYYLTLDRGTDDDGCVTLFGTATELFRAIDAIACEVAHRHPIAYHRWNPRRRWVPGCCKFMRLAEAIGLESETDEYGETYVKTIDGWWTV